MLLIGDVLTQPECGANCETLENDTVWRDGTATAKGQARDVKRNVQADLTVPEVKAALKKVQKALLANEIFCAAAQPAQFARLIISRYSEGMAYGGHVDAAYLDDVRTDLSFTLFLNSASSYEGGELVVNSADREDAIKGDAGNIVLDPSNAVHRDDPLRPAKGSSAFGG